MNSTLACILLYIKLHRWIIKELKYSTPLPDLPCLNTNSIQIVHSIHRTYSSSCDHHQFYSSFTARFTKTITEYFTCFRYDYKTETDLDGSTHWGLLAHYSGGGYVQNMNTTRRQSLQIISELRDNLWLDRGTRAVFIDFTVYNANINLFCVIRYMIWTFNAFC